MSERQLTDLLAAAKGGPITFRSRTVVMMHTLRIAAAGELEFELRFRSDAPRIQGLRVAVEGGVFELRDDWTERELVFWQDTLPSTGFSLRVVPTGACRVLLWNCWRMAGEPDRRQEWVGNAGIAVVEGSDAEVALGCSCGFSDPPNFEDLMVCVRVR